MICRPGPSFLAPTGGAGLICPSWTRGRGSQVRRPADACHPFNLRKEMASPIVETRSITGGVDTHADVHVAAALDPIGGLVGVREFPASPAGSAPRDAVSAARAAQSGRARGAPKGRDGTVEAIRALMVARRSAAGERTQTI